MSNNLQIEEQDEQATLKLAKQIGLKRNCNPCIDLPNKVDKHSAAHWKLVYKYFQKYHSPKKKLEKDNNHKNIRNTSNQNNNSGLGLSFYTNTSRDLFTSEKKRKQPDHDDFRIQTARTTFGRRTNIFSNSKTQKIISNNSNQQSLQKQKSKSKKVRQNKNLLFNLWKQHQLQKKSKNKIKQPQPFYFPMQLTKINKQQKSKKQKTKQIRIKYNSTIKSFEFC